jgi:indolepyruvate ferredoxin oxidoreductase, beta subunit
MPNISTPHNRPITLALLAMGGEGGGVLADWAVDMAEHNGFFAQTTSVPGVAQRTGTTVYYLEFFPDDGAGKPGVHEPVLSTMATPGEVDIVVASELMEAGRAISRGFVTSDITTFITSTHRVYSMTERTSMGDGRVDSEEIIKSAKEAAKKFIAADFAKVAEESGSVISAALFGAIAGSGALPFPREQFIASIERGGVGVKTSIAAFDKSYELAKQAGAELEKPVNTGVPIQIGKRPVEPGEISPEAELAITNDPSSVVGSKLKSQAAKVKSDFPESTRVMVINGVKRTADFQSVAYADRYLNRLSQICEADEKYGNGTGHLLNETARYTALWMTYEDTIRVADLKTRRSRFERVSAESKISDEQIMEVREYLHPMSEEIADTLPTPIGKWILRTKPVTKTIEKISADGIILNTASIGGYLLLYFVARLKPIRPRSLRFNLEQERIDTWLAKINTLAATNYDLACEVCECANVIKGYGETHRNGWRNFTAIMAEVDKIADNSDAASRIKELRQAALADEDGSKLRNYLKA